MGYIEENLLPDERIVCKAELHWIVFVTLGRLLVMLLFLPMGLFMSVGAIFTSEFVGSFLVYSLLFLAIGFIPLVGAFLRFTTSEFGVTSKRIIAKTGWLRRQSSEIKLEKIEGVSVDQGIIGRMVGFGTVVVTGTGGKIEPFRLIVDPLGFRQKVYALTGQGEKSDEG